MSTGSPVGETIKLLLEHGDMYVMSEKASGWDWKKKVVPTLRHAAGCEKFLKLPKKPSGIRKKKEEKKVIEEDESDASGEEDDDDEVVEEQVKEKKGKRPNKSKGEKEKEAKRSK